MYKKIYPTQNLLDNALQTNTGEDNYIRTIPEEAKLFYSGQAENMDAYQRRNSKQGFLKAQVTAAQQAIPLDGALITITTEIGNAPVVFAKGRTDINGIYGPVALPTPDKRYSESPEEPILPFATYDILVEYPGYRSVQLYRVPIFDGITSIQQVNMVPNLSSHTPEVIVESEPNLTKITSPEPTSPEGMMPNNPTIPNENPPSVRDTTNTGMPRPTRNISEVRLSPSEQSVWNSELSVMKR